MSHNVLKQTVSSHPRATVAMAPKRGSYSKSLRQFPETVATPQSTEEYTALCKAIIATQQSVKRWESSQPENCARANAFLQVQLAARTAARSIMSSKDLLAEAHAGEAEFVKQAAIARRAHVKLEALGRRGYGIAVDSHTDPEEALTRRADAEATLAALQPTPPSKRSKRSKRDRIETVASVVDAAAAAIDDETNAHADAIERGEFTPM